MNQTSEINDCVCVYLGTIYGSLNDDGCRDLNVIKQDVLEKIRQNELHNKYVK